MPPMSGACQRQLDLLSALAFSATIASVVTSKARNRGRILERRTYNLSRVNNARLDHVSELIVLGVVTDIVVFAFNKFANDD